MIIIIIIALIAITRIMKIHLISIKFYYLHNIFENDTYNNLYLLRHKIRLKNLNKKIKSRM